MGPAILVPERPSAELRQRWLETLSTAARGDTAQDSPGTLQPQPQQCGPEQGPTAKVTIIHTGRVVMLAQKAEGGSMGTARDSHIRPVCSVVHPRLCPACLHRVS
ncbi:hypothetical protein H8959_012151 [Pygathrix nigripes]